MINLFGPYKGNNPYGYAGIPLDNVGVQYGLQALEQSLITPEQFIDINQKIGGYDNNYDTTTSRFAAEEPALTNGYRGGAVNAANNLKQVEGHFPKNDVIWFGEAPLIGDPNYAAKALVAMDGWLSAVEADRRNVSLEQKIADDRPSTVHDQCSDIPDVDQVDVPDVGEVCQSPLLQTRFATPRMVAGESIATDQEKCELKPLRLPEGRLRLVQAGRRSAPDDSVADLPGRRREGRVRRRAAGIRAGELRHRVDEPFVRRLAQPIKCVHGSAV